MSNKINRRKFFSAALGVNKSLPIIKDNSEYFQDIKLNLTKNTSTKNSIIFSEQKKVYFHTMKCLFNVSFSEFPYEKTDIFFEKFLESKKINTLNRYAITTFLPENSANFWKKIVWITSKIPENIPKMNCPILILQDIEDFNPTQSPSELLPLLPPQSDIFISQKLDIQDNNSPATKRVMDFLS